MPIKIENPVALHFIMQDELYFLNKEKELYNNTDVAEDAAAEEVIAAVANTVVIADIVEELPVAEIKYLGENKSSFLILVHYPGLEFIHESHLTALDNILKRKGLAIDDMAIVNMANHSDAGFEDLVAYFDPKKILLLGGNALPAGIRPLTLNVPQQMENRALLYSFSFDEMMDSNDNKRAFWEQMKNL